jgi:mRNA interferase RelE/StbE
LNYTVEFTPQAFEDLSSLDPSVAGRIMAPEPLQGRFKGLCKLRIGDWRALYTIDPKRSLITIHVVAHRSKIYKAQSLRVSLSANETKVCKYSSHCPDLKSGKKSQSSSLPQSFDYLNDVDEVKKEMET